MAPLPFAAAELRAVLAPFEDARPLPALAYWDPAVFAFDTDEVFARAWRCVGREDELARPGDWLLAPLTPEGILVVRGEDAVVRAFYNVCRHRGTTLVEGPCGHAAAGTLACPYHRWTYALDGALRSSPGAWAGIDRASHGLRPARVSAWRGFLFVCLDPDAPALIHALGEVPPWLAALPPLRLAHRARYEVRANWKLCVENFQESHHFPLVHPALEALTPCERAASVLGDGPWLGGVMDLVPGAETVSPSGGRAHRPFIVPEDARRRVFDAHLFPGLLTSLQPDYLLTYRLHPVAPDRTLILADTLVHPACPEGDGAADVVAFWERVNAEDRAICERQQLGVRSRGYDPAGYARVEDGVHAFDRLVARRYAAALGANEEPEPEPEPDAEPASAPETPRLCGIFGRPYLDLSDEFDTSVFPALDDEIAYGLARVETTRTGGSLKSMKVVAPWVHDDPYVDYAQVIARFSREEFLRFTALAEDPAAFDPARQGDYAFGDETDHPLTPEQITFLLYRYRVYFPWRVCYHLLENDRWEDKHSGAGKTFTAEAEETFPRTVAFLRALPFTEIGRCVIFGMGANDHAPAHRDSEPGEALSIAQSISIDPRGNKRFYLCDPAGGSRTVVDAPLYWFNDMDYHGVLADPFFRYSVRVDGVFDPAFLRALRRKHGR